MIPNYVIDNEENNLIELLIPNRTWEAIQNSDMRSDRKLSACLISSLISNKMLSSNSVKAEIHLVNFRNITKRYLPVKKFLLENGLIHQTKHVHYADPALKFKNHSKSYSFNIRDEKQLNSDPLSCIRKFPKTFQVNKIIAKIESNQQLINSKLLVDSKIEFSEELYNKLISGYKRNNVGKVYENFCDDIYQGIDDGILEKARNILNHTIETVGEKYPGKVTPYKLNCEEIVTIRSKFEDAAEKAREFAGKSFIKIDNFGNRAYSCYTQMPKEIRACLISEGEKLAEFDMSNANFVFLSKALNDHGLCDPKFMLDVVSGKFYDTMTILIDEGLKKAGLYYGLFTREHVKMIAIPFIFGDAYNESMRIFLPENDIARYIKFCHDRNENESFFKFIGYKTNHKFEPILTGIDPKTDKPYYFKQLNHAIIELFVNALKERYNNFYEAVCTFKKKFGYKSMSKNLFRMESDFMRNFFVKEFVKLSPKGTTLITIHDCILTDHSQSENLVKAFKTAFDKYFVFEDFSQNSLEIFGKEPVSCCALIREKFFDYPGKLLPFESFKEWQISKFNKNK